MGAIGNTMQQYRQPDRNGSDVRRKTMCCMALICGLLPAYAPALQVTNLADLSFDELANIKVISVSKKAERIGSAPASIFVITNEDIRHSGATTLPEALRLAPNLQIAQSNAQNYVISARGFNSSISNNSIANKLLVLIDGRIVYTPLFSGVFWDTQDVMLEDIERIEVISGPGGTLWGTNAVNGVINIITRSANDTQGTLLAGTLGNRQHGATMRYGGALENGTNYRIYAKNIDYDNTERANIRPARDAWNRTQMGFRADWTGGLEQLTLQGDAYDGDLDQTNTVAKTSGLNLSTHWGHNLGDGASTSLLAYYDQTIRKIPGSYSETLDIFNLDFQHTLPTYGAHALIWGASYRYSLDRLGNSAALGFLPAQLNQKWLSLFAQDEISLREDLRLILGARLERNDYTGVEVLPSARLAWQLNEQNMLWTAASRAVRAPSRLDRDWYLGTTLVPNTNFRSEVAHVYELGYRAQPTNALSYSATAFLTQYDDLRSIERVVGSQFILGNEMFGLTRGIETWGSWQATPTWRLSAGFTALQERLTLKPGSTDPTGASNAGNDPSHTWQLRSLFALTPDTDFDLMVRHVAALPRPVVPAYTSVDARLAWRLQHDFELSVTGQNLFGGQDHAEFGTTTTRSLLPSGFFVKLVWRN